VWLGDGHSDGARITTTTRDPDAPRGRGARGDPQSGTMLYGLRLPPAPSSRSGSASCVARRSCRGRRRW
jgi:hypothetical protein